MRPNTSSLRLVLILAVTLLAAPATLAAPGDVPQHLVTLTLTVGQADPVTFSVPGGAMATFESATLGHRLGIVAHVVDAAAGDVDVELVDLAARPAGKAERVAGQAAVAAPTERVTGKVGFQGAATVGTVPVDVVVVAVAPASAAVQQACAEASVQGSIEAGSEAGLEAGLRAGDGVGQGGHGPGATERITASISDPVIPPGCCVSCDSITVCACQVERGCGTCCGCGLC